MMNINWETFFDHIYFAVILLILIGYIVYYNLFKCSKLNLFYQHNEKNNWIMNCCPEIANTIYRPTFYLCNGLLQSFCYEIPRRIFKPYLGRKFEPQEVPLEDGGEIVLDWPINLPKNWTPKDPIIAILPGLTGGIDETYCLDVIDFGCQRGFRAVILNHRGCSNHKLKSAKLYCAASTNDTDAGIQAIHKLYPESSIYLFGISLGANLAVNYVGERPEQKLVKGVVTQSNPFDLLIDNIYSDYVAFGLFHKVLGIFTCEMLKSHMKEILPLEKMLGYTIDEGIAKVKTLRDFDNLFTSRFFNYSSAFDYYRKASCISKIPHITVPTFMLNSEDDPLIPALTFPIKECQVNPNIILATHPCGGHTGFFHGWKPKSWFCLPSFAFLEAIRALEKSSK